VRSEKFPASLVSDSFRMRKFSGNPCGDENAGKFIRRNKTNVSRIFYFISTTTLEGLKVFIEMVSHVVQEKEG